MTLLRCNLEIAKFLARGPACMTEPWVKGTLLYFVRFGLSLSRIGISVLKRCFYPPKGVKIRLQSRGCQSPLCFRKHCSQSRYRHKMAQSHIILGCLGGEEKLQEFSPRSRNCHDSALMPFPFPHSATKAIRFF